MNGFLSHQGKFYKCEYGQHGELARKLQEKYRLSPLDSNFNVLYGEERVKYHGFIYFGDTGNRGTNTDSYVFVDLKNIKFTKEQIDWFGNNKGKLTAKQNEEFIILMEIFK